MKSLEELTYRGQARRIRPIALAALAEAGVPFHTVELIFHGENTTFRARHPSGDHLVRVHRPGYQNARTIASELELLAAIRQTTDLVVPQPVAGVLRHGAPGVRPRDVVVFRWIHGRFSRRFTPGAMRRLGGFAGRLHRFAETYVPGDRFDRQFHTIEGLTGENMGGSLDQWPPESRGLVDEIVERAADVWDALGRGRDVWGIIHADLHHANRLLTPDGRLAAIDWDDCGFGHYLYDICVMLGFPYARHRDVYPALQAAFVAGYRQERALSDEHLALLPAFFAMRAVVITLWVLGRQADNPFFAERARTEIDATVRYLEDLAALTW